ncbi:MAG: 3-isopropylmalate dehydrogenase, partial [Gaiellales bacterium]|nr:3-isopropylmalate dehydrogenase [Gaiellales bacterium]
MKTYAICVLAGDGIGPEVTAAAVAVLAGAGAAHGFAIDVDEQPFGGAAIDALGNPFPAVVEEACRRADAVLLGAVGGPRWERDGPRPEEGIMRLRKALDVYANSDAGSDTRSCSWWHSWRSRHSVSRVLR